MQGGKPCKADLYREQRRRFCRYNRLAMPDRKDIHSASRRRQNKTTGKTWRGQEAAAGGRVEIFFSRRRFEKNTTRFLTAPRAVACVWQSDPLALTRQKAKLSIILIRPVSFDPVESEAFYHFKKAVVLAIPMVQLTKVNQAKVLITPGEPQTQLLHIKSVPLDRKLASDRRLFAESTGSPSSSAGSQRPVPGWILIREGVDAPAPWVLPSRLTKNTTRREVKM